jgi:UDPglucose--hexose-1-phosphate uridylyltransferase
VTAQLLRHDLDAAALDLAKVVRDVVHRNDGLFDIELPYMMCVQEAPTGATDWHLHVEFPPPHRSADRFKVRASVETALGVFINDTLPERSAERLSAVSPPRSNWVGVTVPAVQAATTVEMTQP